MATPTIKDRFAGWARIPKWLRLTLAIVGGIGAAFALIVYLANGIVVGDLIGVHGRDHDIAIAQRDASIGLLSGVLLQLGVVGALFSYMEGEGGYKAGRIVRAMLASVAVTGACGVIIFLGLRASR